MDEYNALDPPQMTVNRGDVVLVLVSLSAATVVQIDDCLKVALDLP
jgi:hypothetical protein